MLIRADARHIPLADAVVDCVVTSPPYFGLRDYGVSGQIGLEPTPDAFVAALVGVFREVRRVLKDDGVCWLNLGDSYNNADKWGGGSPNTGKHVTDKRNGEVPSWAVRRKWSGMEGAKPKDLLGIPWMVAFALRADGWYLRSDVIWHKPNPMPESVTDRPTKAHEYLFLLTKSERYYYDAEAISEASVGEAPVPRMRLHDTVKAAATQTGGRESSRLGTPAATRRNKRSVWTIPTMPYSGAHFATMPEKLVEPCILAGSRPGDLVFDPFIGSGTVGAVATRLGRRWAGTDLNPAYHALAKKRTAQRGLMFSSSREATA